MNDLSAPFWSTQITSVITAVFALATAFGHGLSVDQQIAILGVAGAIVGLLQAVYAAGHAHVRAATIRAGRTPDYWAGGDTTSATTTGIPMWSTTTTYKKTSDVPKPSTTTGAT